MPPSDLYAARAAALLTVEARLVAQPADAELLLARANLLVDLGRGDDARAAFLTLLNLAPDHLAGLNNFGALVQGQGHQSAARTLYAEAARRHPTDPMSQVNLGNALVELGESQPAERAFLAALAAAPDYAPAHRGLARLAGERGDPAAAERHLRAAFATSPLIEEPYRGAGPAIDVLLLISGLQADIPLRHVLDPKVFKVTALAPEFFDRAAALPRHQVVMNIIGDADLRPGALRAAAGIILGSDRPVINDPDRVLLTGRVANADRLRDLPGVTTARAAFVTREAAMDGGAAMIAALGLRFPVAARAPGYHTGQHFERIDGPDALAPALGRLPGDGVILMDFVDTRGADGLYRKYRVMIVDGRLYPLHLAVSSSWKVHFFTAGMADQPTHRTLDAAFLADMPGVLGDRAMQALEQVRDRLGLDYGGVDFALSAGGEVVVFEANATMVVYPPPPDSIGDYRRAPTEQVLQAVKAMIAERAGRSPQSVARADHPIV